METQISVIEKPFVRAREKFEQLCQKLESTSVLTMTHSEVESCLQVEGALLLRHLFQDHLDLRTLREKKVQGIHSGGKNSKFDLRGSKQSLGKSQTCLLLG